MMKKWAFIEMVGEIGAAVFGIMAFFASIKRDEDVDERVHRLMLEDKANRDDERKG